MSRAEEADSVERPCFELFVPDGLVADVVEESVEDALFRVVWEAQVGEGEVLAEEAESEQIPTQFR